MSAPVWEPGDALYEHPIDRRDAGVARPLFDVLDDDSYVWRALREWRTTCEVCHVAWDEGDDGPDCWFCGRPGDPPWGFG